ncbi:MAG: hypothetical protein ACI4JF_09010 [Oscillospiraceae bacterium]
MAMYDVTPEKMRSIANQVDNLTADYANLYNNNLLQQLVSGDLADAYKGTDAQTLIERIKSYKIPFDAMKQQLNTYAEFLRATAASYENKRDELAQQAASIGRN